MYYVSIGVTGKDHLINLFRNTSSICLLHPYSCLDKMARFHLPGDPYFPNQGNGGWIKSELVEEDPEESSDEENEEEVQEDSDLEPEV